MKGMDNRNIMVSSEAYQDKLFILYAFNYQEILELNSYNLARMMLYLPRALALQHFFISGLPRSWSINASINLPNLPEIIIYPVVTICSWSLIAIGHKSTVCCWTGITSWDPVLSWGEGNFPPQMNSQGGN